MAGSDRLLIETQYFPPLDFFKLAASYPTVILEAKEHYQKGGYRNRCQIAGPNGIHRLTVPLVKGKNNKAPIREIKISNIDPWQKIHWHSIQTAYGKSPFFEYYQDDIKPIFKKEWNYLFDLNLEIIQTLQPLLQLSFDLEMTSEYQVAPLPFIKDCRNFISPKHKVAPNNAPKKYPQVFEAKNGFLPNLSILDLLFCLGPEAYFYLDPN